MRYYCPHLKRAYDISPTTFHNIYFPFLCVCGKEIKQNTLDGSTPKYISQLNYRRGYAYDRDIGFSSGGENTPKIVFATKGGGLPFFKANTMEPQELKITITKAQLEELPSGWMDGQSPVIYFNHEKEERRMPLNRTNARKIIELSGSDNTDKWTGQKVTLYKVMVNNPTTKKEVASLRIR